MSVIVPLERLVDPRELERLLSSVLTDGVSSYFLWTPGVTEERLLAERLLFIGLVQLISPPFPHFSRSISPPTLPRALRPVARALRVR